MSTSKWPYAPTLLALAILWQVLPARAESNSELQREARLRAAFIFNFASFTEWPSEGEPEKFRVGIWKDNGANEVAQKEFAGKSAKGKSIEVLKFEPETPPAGLRILVIDADADEAELKKVLAPIAQRGVLTVSRYDHHCARGVIVCFVKEADKLRFKINKSALEKANLKMSSQLLKLARIVEN